MTVVARLGKVVEPAVVAVGSCRTNSGEAGRSRRSSGVVADSCHMSPGGWEVEGGDHHMPNRCRIDLEVGSSRVGHLGDNPCNPLPEDTAWPGLERRMEHWTGDMRCQVEGRNKPHARFRMGERPGDCRKSLACLRLIRRAEQSNWQLVRSRACAQRCEIATFPFLVNGHASGQNGRRLART